MGKAICLERRSETRTMPRRRKSGIFGKIYGVTQLKMAMAAGSPTSCSLRLATRLAPLDTCHTNSSPKTPPSTHTQTPTARISHVSRLAKPPSLSNRSIILGRISAYLLQNTWAMPAKTRRSDRLRSSNAQGMPAISISGLHSSWLPQLQIRLLRDNSRDDVV